MSHQLLICEGWVHYLEDLGPTVMHRKLPVKMAEEMLANAVSIIPADPKCWMGYDICVNGRYYFRTDKTKSQETEPEKAAPVPKVSKGKGTAAKPKTTRKRVTK